ncbi:MAG: nickel pincer cofactor biosynthesis protein LarC [Methanoregulaceae archaeon]|nr:nickel pincer cofactor biosynthesis protein LarC [Methanoregulaceae archaeon]
MRFLLIDPFHGAAGDMITGALLACGADETRVRSAMRSVVTEPTIRVVDRAGIRAIKVDTHATISHRTMADVEARIMQAAVSDAVRVMALRVFHRIEVAEKTIHGENAHFHDVGADDAIADVIGACSALESLSVDGVVVRPVALGTGRVKTAHGSYPVPAPATLAILAGSTIEIKVEECETDELCTPTGAALLAEFATISPSCPETAVVRAAGYGAGDRNPAVVPNVIRIALLETVGGTLHDTVDILETNVDDITGEVLGAALARLMTEGARDASAIPCLMKKGRAGYLVRAICMPEDAERLATVMAAELGTLGIRCQESVHRFIADRTLFPVRVEIGGKTADIPVKCGIMDGRCFTLKVEFDAARTFADELGIPVTEVIRRTEELARIQYRPDAGDH